MVNKIRQITDICQAVMADATQTQEKNANRTRIPAKRFKKGDKVWLDLRNYHTTRPKNKLNWRYAKYTVFEVVGPSSLKLKGIPGHIYNQFHTDVIRRAPKDPLPSQVNLPQSLLTDMKSMNQRRFSVPVPERSGEELRDVLVHWKGYSELFWHPLSDFENNQVLDVFEGKYGPATENNGPLHKYTVKNGKRKGKQSSSNRRRQD